MAFAEDLAEFMDTTTGFAENLTIGAASVAVIFDIPYGDGFGIVAGSLPSFIAASADVSSLAVVTSISRGAIGYTVTAIEPDGTGLTRVRLQESS